MFNPTSPKGFRDAKTLLEKAIELDPGIASAWNGLAFVHFAASQAPIPGVSVPNSKDLSLQAAQKAVSLDPKDAEGHWMVGVGYARNGQPERGMASCNTAMELNPNNDCAYVCAGLASMSLGKSADALSNFRHALRLNPGFEVYVYGARACLQWRRYRGHQSIESRHHGCPGESTCKLCPDVRACLERSYGRCPELALEGLRLAGMPVTAEGL